MTRSRLAMWSAIAVLALGLISTPARPAIGGGRLDLIVPGGLIGPMSEIIPAFEKKTGVKVKWETENMALLTNAVIAGKAKPDVFLSLGDVEINRAAGAVAISSGVMFAQNSMAIMTPASNPAGVKTVQDLASPKVTRVALPDPKLNSSGKYAVQAMKRAGVWKAVEPKLLVTLRSSESKAAALKGEVEAAFDFYPCRLEAAKPGDPPREPEDLHAIEVPQKLYQPFRCEAGVLDKAAHPAEAKQFVDFLLTPEAQQAMVKWGFGAVKGAVCTGGVCPVGAGPGGVD